MITLNETFESLVEQHKLKDLIKKAKKQGFRIERTKKNQTKFIPPDKAKQIVVAAGTPSDKRAFKNLLALLRNSGFQHG